MEALTGQMLFDFEAEPLKPVEALSVQPAPAQPLGGLAGPGEAWFDYALELERTGAPTREIIGVYYKILESSPDAAGAWLNIGTLQYRDGDLVLAERSYKRALEIYPEYPLAHFNLGNVCEQLNRLDEAADHYRAALRHQQDYADAHYNLALLLERSRCLLEAVGHWQAYLNLDPSSAWSNIARRKRRNLLSLAAGGQFSPGDSFSKPLREERS